MTAAGTLRRGLWKATYQAAARGLLEQYDFMNFGYAPLPGEPEIDAGGAEPCGAALYLAAADGLELAGRRVLEVGCGRGGGAALLCRRFRPARYLGIDFAPAQIALGRRRFAGIDGLELAVGDAEALDLPAGGFDAVINIESSHGYGSFARFLHGARRALAPGGRMAWLDFRPARQLPGLRRDLAAAGLRVIRERDITANVVRALDVDAARRLAAATEQVARVLRAPGRIFCAVQGSWTYRRLQRGDHRYLHLLLEPVSASR